jgi:tRNA pseudouridine55 synthase
MATDLHGALVVDKARGPTSHDVVAQARRALGTRAIGHTGTLDPMATGTLVLVVGEATKLVNLLSDADKAYDASVLLGSATTTLDAEGEVSEERPVPALDLEGVRQVAAQFVGELLQRAPLVSAIKVGGRPLHQRVRAGEAPEAPLRRVWLHEIDVRAVAGSRIDLTIRCGKGFYVRSLARDLALALGTVGHLAALRRTMNAGFTLPGSVGFEMLQRAARGSVEDRRHVLEQVIPLAALCRRLPHLTLNPSGVDEARHGRPIGLAHVDRTELALATSVIALSRGGEPIAIVQPCEAGLRVVRGFRTLSV